MAAWRDHPVYRGRSRLTDRPEAAIRFTEDMASVFVQYRPPVNMKERVCRRKVVLVVFVVVFFFFAKNCQVYTPYSNVALWSK